MLRMAIQPRYTGRATFARLPELQDEPCAAGIIGVPFDQGASFRPGQRFGPAAIREASRLIRPVHPVTGVDVFAAGSVRDCGDAPIGNDIMSSIEVIRAYIAAHVARGIRPVLLGGDHTVSLPALRAIAQAHGRLGVIHLDAHSDTEDALFGSRYNHGTPFRRAIEEGLVDPARMIQIGLRGSLSDAGEWDAARGLGLELIPMHEAQRHTMAELAQTALRRAGSGPVYISVDVDACDPAFAPGTGVPEAGGFSSRELVEMLRGVRGVRAVGGDVVEVLPAADPSGITALLAANIAYELLALVSAA